MNGVIAVCQFCENHGPVIVFCTQVESNNVNKGNDNGGVGNNGEEDEGVGSRCESCESLGMGDSLITYDEEFDVNYISSQVARNLNTRELLKQAAIRSLTCEFIENKSKKEESQMSFGTETSHIVLSNIFHIADSNARGFYQPFAIILLMNDQMALYQIWQFFIHHSTQIVQQLKNKAYHLYQTEIEQTTTTAQHINNRHSRTQRNSRLQTELVARSLAVLCDMTDIWGYLHQQFTWMLKNAPNCTTSRSYKSEPTLSRIKESIHHYSTNGITLRQIINKLGQMDFRALSYCLLYGIQVVIRSDENICISVSEQLKLLLAPDSLVYYSTMYLPENKCKLLSVKMDVPLPSPSQTHIFRIDIFKHNWIVKYDLHLRQIINEGEHCDLLKLILEAAFDSKLSDIALNAYIRSLMYKWTNDALTLMWSNGGSLNGFGNTVDSLTTTQKQLLSSLNIKHNDIKLLKYWMQCLKK